MNRITLHVAFCIWLTLHGCLWLLRREQAERRQRQKQGTSKETNAVIQYEKGLKLDGRQDGKSGQYILVNWTPGMRERKVKDNAGFQLEHRNRADINPGSRAGGGAGWEDTAGAGFWRC